MEPFSYAHTHQQVQYHLNAAVRLLAAKYPWWRGPKPTPAQKRAMGKAERKIQRAAEILDAAADTGPDIDAFSDRDIT